MNICLAVSWRIDLFFRTGGSPNQQWWLIMTMSKVCFCCVVDADRETSSESYRPKAADEDTWLGLQEMARWLCHHRLSYSLISNKTVWWYILRTKDLTTTTRSSGHFMDEITRFDLLCSRLLHKSCFNHYHNANVFVNSFEPATKRRFDLKCFLCSLCSTWSSKHYELQTREEQLSALFVRLLCVCDWQMDGWPISCCLDVLIIVRAKSLELKVLFVLLQHRDEEKS